MLKHLCLWGSEGSYCKTSCGGNHQGETDFWGNDPRSFDDGGDWNKWNNSILHLIKYETIKPTYGHLVGCLLHEIVDWCNFEYMDEHNFIT